jgi:hypothetical protein
MMTKTTTALAACLILAIASAAQASSDKDASDNGGFHIGPLGQPMGAPYAWGAAAPWFYNNQPEYGSYAYAPRRGLISRSWYSEP